MSEDEKNTPQQNAGDDLKKVPEPELIPTNQGEAARDKFDINQAEYVVSGDGATIQHIFGMSYEESHKQRREDWEGITKLVDHILEHVSGLGNTDHLRNKLSRSRRNEHEAENEAASVTASSDDVVKFPKTFEGVEEWYDQLSDYDQCFVQAVSVLHGAPLFNVSEAAAKLYQALQEATASHEGNSASQGSSSSSSTARRLVRRELLKRTWVTIRRENHVERIFWRSTTVQEQRAFTLLMLRFFAAEFVITYSGPRFSDTLKEWAESMHGECSRKAARALGIVLYHQDANELWRAANNWADGSNSVGWQLAASALDGAYDVHKLEDEKSANDIRKSPIFRLLNQWVERAQNAHNPRVGCAAANTYGLISQKVPDIALGGLESLLCFPESATSTDWESISVSVWVQSVSNYVGLAWSGYVRQVLDHLAIHAEKLIYQRQRPTKESDRESYRRRCKLNLEAIFDIFFPIALSSLIGIRDDVPANYSLTIELPKQPEIPDEQGRDILLAGILSEGEPHWYNCIATLLCAAIFAGKVKGAFFFMRQWAEVVLRDTSADKEQLEAVYVDFVVNVGKMVQQWRDKLTIMRLGLLPAPRTFTHNLELWKDRRRPQPIDEFIQKVLAKLDA